MSDQSEGLPSWRDMEKEPDSGAHSDVRKALCEAIAKAEETKAFGVVSLLLHEGGFYLSMGAIEDCVPDVHSIGDAFYRLLTASLRAVGEDEEP